MISLVILVGVLYGTDKNTEKAQNELAKANIMASYTLWNGSTKNQAILVLCYNIPEADKEKIKPKLVTIEDIAQQGLGWHEAVVVKRQFGEMTRYNCASETVPRSRDLEITLELNNNYYTRTDKILVST